MEQLPASRTAVRVALQRAVHQVLDDEPRVFSDPVAVGLFPEATEAAIRGQADQFLQPSWRRIRANFLLRSRQAENSLAEAVARGVKQYVVLGAGLDTFAYRQPTWAKNILRFFADCCCEKGAPSGQLEIKTPLYLPCPLWATD